MKKNIEIFIEHALNEDIQNGDITTLTTIPSNKIGKAIFIVKENCIIAGIELTTLICHQVDPDLKVSFEITDGNFIAQNTIIGNIFGCLHSILKAERLILNCMQRMSAIATKTQMYVNLTSPYNVKILDTRKTTPNFRICEKWAVKIGGGINHRFGLYDEILIKDNHIKAAGGIKNTIESCIKYINENKLKVPIIVEVKNAEEFNIIKHYDIVDRILLDNFSPKKIKELIENNNPKKTIEASGGINLSNIIEYAQSGIDYISVGDITHHVASIDISLKII